jgi:hypothetical protein
MATRLTTLPAGASNVRAALAAVGALPLNNASIRQEISYRETNAD